MKLRYLLRKHFETRRLLTYQTIIRYSKIKN